MFSGEKENGMLGLFSGVSRCCIVSLTRPRYAPQTMHHFDNAMKSEFVDKGVYYMAARLIASKGPVVHRIPS